MARSVTTFQKGHLVPQKTRDAVALRQKGNINHLGMLHTPETRLKISEALKGKTRAEKNGMWKGGVSKIDKLCRCMPEYKQWRSDVFQRDAWACRTCHETDCYVTAHHIKGLSVLIRKNNVKTTEDARHCGELWDISNGVTLCEKCHALTDNYAGRTRVKDRGDA